MPSRLQRAFCVSLARFRLRQRRLRSRLILLVLATFLPLGCFAVVMLFQFAHETRRTTERGMRDTARALALAMDRELGEASLALGMLTISRSLAAGDLAGFYQRCLEALQLLPPAAWLTLSDSTGQVLFSTRRPYGAALPKQVAVDGVQGIVATGQPEHSDLVIDALTQEPVVHMHVPVIRNGQVTAVLSLTRPAVTLGQLFTEQRLPAGWVAGVNDRQQRILARSVEATRFIGTPVTPRMAAYSSAALEGWFPNRSQEGKPIYTAFSHVPSTGWTMVLFAPAAVVDAPGRRLLWLLISGWLILSTAAVGVALWLSQRLATPIQRLVPATQALAQGVPVRFEPAGGAVQEVQEVVTALHETAALLQQRTAALQEQSTRWQITLASIGDAVIATDSQGHVTFLNPVAATLTGWTEAEALGQHITAVFPIVNEYTRQAVDNPVTRVLQEGTVVGLANHTLLLARHGREYFIDDSGAPMRDLQGQLLGVVLVFRDISARRQAEEARMHLAAIVSSSEDAIFSKTLDGLITSWNHGAERLYGYTAAEMIGQSLALLMPPDLSDELPRILAQLRDGEPINHYETQRLHRDGTRLDVALTISPMRNSAGQIIGASTIAHDITMRKQAEAELERRRQETALLAELAQRLSASLDLDTVLQRVVSGAQTLCHSERAFLALRIPGTDTFAGRYEIGAQGKAYADFQIVPGQGLGGQVLLTGHPWRTADYATDPRFSKDLLTRARAEGHLAVLAVPILIAERVEGLLYASNRTSQPFTERDEAILVHLATHAALAMQNARLYQQAQAEIAERQRAEAALAQAAAELEQRVVDRTAALQWEIAERQRLEQEAQRVQHFALLGRLAAGVSHEIRNPLGAVFLQVDVLAEELSDHAPESAALVADTLTEIRVQLGRLEDLVQDYLSLVRAAQIERTPEDLGAALCAWALEWQVLAASQGITCTCSGLEDLGVVSIHANTLRRALLNLVQNALEAMPHGGSLILRGQRQDTLLQIEVGDTGCGISSAQQARIFEPLYTTKPGGTGLGLYIVQEVVAAHGGKVAVHSREGQGSTFTITLPLEYHRETS
ncbi:MAG: PAS domain S-box protein [Candidatus Tectimicrobiota bacterium]